MRKKTFQSEISINGRPGIRSQVLQLPCNGFSQFIKWLLTLLLVELKMEFQVIDKMSVVVSKDKGEGESGVSNSLKFPCM